MHHTISISESIFNMLDQEAKRTRLSPNDLAERLSTEQQVWRTQFDRLLARTLV